MLQINQICSFLKIMYQFWVYILDWSKIDNVHYNTYECHQNSGAKNFFYLN